MKGADYLVGNGTVLVMDDAGTRIANGAVAVQGDTIVAVGPADRFEAWHIDRRIDARGGLILPGLINTHTHAAMTLLRGIADDLPLMTWLDDHIFPAEARLDQEMVQTGATLACAEMILSGTTCFCDMYLFEAGVALAARQAGMRALVGEVLFDFDSPNYGSVEAGFNYTQRLFDEWSGDSLITVSVDPHSPYLCAPSLLQRADALARRHNAPLVIHLSETSAEVARIKERFGVTPVRHLADLGLLGPHVVACHAVVLTEEDIELLHRHQVKVSHNPESNMKLASGIAPVPELLAAGVCVGLGTDGCSSNNNLDLLAEMDTAAKLHKVSRLDPTVMPADTVLRMATIDAARVLGLDRTIGSLEPGKWADLIVIDTAQPHLTPMYDPVSHLVYAARGSDVVHSLIHGRLVMENRRLTTIDVEKTMAEARRLALMLGP